MTDAPDLEPAGLEAAWLAHDNACPGEHWKKRERMAVAIRAYLAARSAPEAGKAVTDAMVKRATQEFLSHRGERPERIKRGGYELWEENAPAMRAALTAALASSPAPTGAEPVAPTGEVAGLLTQLSECADYFEKFYGRTKTVATIREAADALTASEAEAADLSRKLEEHQDAEDKAAREMATVIQGLRNRATAAERKLEEAREALEEVRGHFRVEYPISVGGKPSIGYDSEALPKVIAILDRTLSGASE